VLYFCTFGLATNGNLKVAVDFWVSDQAAATETYGDISTWDVSTVTDMAELFRSKETFNADISGWDVSSVTNMDYMFGGAFFFNQNISAWNVSSVTDMDYMFYEASTFNQDLCAWGTQLESSSIVTNMFSGSGCSEQKSPDLTNPDQMNPLCYDCSYLF
jgi:surface protein